MTVLPVGDGDDFLDRVALEVMRRFTRDGGAGFREILDLLAEQKPAAQAGVHRQCGCGGMFDSGAFRPGGQPDRGQLEAAVDEMVAAALVSGRRTTGVLSSLFSIVPGLSGR